MQITEEARHTPTVTPKSKKLVSYTQKGTQAILNQESVMF